MVYNDPEEKNKLLNQLLTLGVITIILITGVYVLYEESEKSNKPVFELYSNNKNLISGSYFIELDAGEDEVWQFQAALSFVPAIMGQSIIGGNEFQPLIFSTSPDVPASVRKYPDLKSTIKISDYGENANEASIKIAEEYWASIKTIVIAGDYASALKVSTLAVKLNLPIIIDGGDTKRFIKDYGVKSAITVGNVKEYSNIGTKHLDELTDIWEMYLDELERNKVICDYIVVANYHDVDFSDERLFIPGLSLASSVLAAGRNALLLVDDYTIDISWIRKLGYGLGEAGAGERGTNEDNLTEEDEMNYQRFINKRAVEIDQDIDFASDFLKKREHNPKYVGLVGGPAALPMLYIESPIWNEGVDQEEKGEEYVATDTYFGDLDIKIGSEDEHINNNYQHLKDELYEQEMAVGRVIGPELVDASALVSRSLGYSKYEYIDDDSGLVSWKRRAVIVTSLMTGDSDNFAAKHQREVFAENWMIAEQYDPPRIAATTDVNGLDVKDQMELSNGIIFDGHGYPDGWYHMWTTTGDEDADWDRIGAEDIYKLKLHAIPVFGACCLSSALDWPMVGAGGSNEKEMTPENCMSLAFIHAGAMCYIGATEESWGEFIGGLLDEDIDAWGYGDFDMPTMFWESLLHGEEIGPALNNAKDKFLEEIWTEPTAKPFARLCILETVLYGDPAAENNNPGLL